MQTIDLICLGKLNARYCAEGVAEYAKRLSAFANFRIIELPEEKIEEKNASPALVARALDRIPVKYDPCLEDILEADRQARRVVCEGRSAPEEFK